MSKRSTELIWQPDKVLPYLFGDLFKKIEAITPIQKIYLFGSRSRVPVSELHTLKGKDWDLVVVCSFKIINTQIWTTDIGYHIDLNIINGEGVKNFFNYDMKMIELFPENNLQY